MGGNWPQAGPTGGAAVFIPVGSAQPVANVFIADRIETNSETARELKTAKSKGRLSIRHSKPRGLPVHRAPHFRRYTRRISLAALFLLYPLAASAVAQNPPGQPPDGWGPYKFDTPRSEVKPGEAVRPGKGPLELLDSATIDNQLYTVSVYFRGDPLNTSTQKVGKVQLHPELVRMNSGQCGRAFEDIAKAVKEKWGTEKWVTFEPKPGTAYLARRLSGKPKSYVRKFGDGVPGPTLTISKQLINNECDVNVTYEAPPAPPLKPIKGSGF